MSQSTLLDEVLEAHGGTERWRTARTVSARARLGGLLRTRMPGNKLADVRIEVDLTRPHVRLVGFPQEGSVGIFDDGEARVETADGEILAQRAGARAAFRGLSGLRRNLRWDALDTSYFAGYAMWNYVSTPFLLAREDVRVEDGEDWTEPGGSEPWRRLEVTFPDGVPTHSARQTFYFDPLRLLRRHDYVAEPIGRWAHGAHYTSEHVDSGGLVFPTVRRVLPIGRGNRALSRPAMVTADISAIEVGWA